MADMMTGYGYEHKEREIDPYEGWRYRNSASMIPQPPAPEQAQYDAWKGDDEKVNDYNQMNQEINPQTQNQPVKPVNPQPAPIDYWNEITSRYEELKPQYNQERQDRIKKLARVNAVGQGLAALGDIFALSQGALVNRRQDDQKMDRYIQMFQAYEDDYDRRKDAYNRGAFDIYVRQLSDQKDTEWRRAEAARQQANLDRQFEFNKDKEEYDKMFNLLKFQEQQGKDRMTAEERERHNRATENLREMGYRLNLAKAQQDEQDKNVFNLYDDSGNLAAKVDTKGAVDKLLSMINTSQTVKTEIDLLKSKFGEGLTAEHKRYLVGKYWDKIPEAREWVMSNSNTGGAEPQKEEATKNIWTDMKESGSGYRPPYAPNAPATTNPVQQRQPEAKQNTTSPAMKPASSDTAAKAAAKAREQMKPEYSTGGWY